MSDLSTQIKMILDDFGDRVADAVNNETDKAIEELVDETKKTAPVGKRKGVYKRAISSKKIKAVRGKTHSQLWYVKAPEHRLTHLLNFGHETRNGGRVDGTGFLSHAVDKVTKNYIEGIEEAIENVE